MDSNIMVIGLVAVAIFTSLTTEAIKKILDEKQVKYSANILAAVVAVVLTVAASIGYIIYRVYHLCEHHRHAAGGRLRHSDGLPGIPLRHGRL